jgi:hypothetical protein
MRFGRPPPTNPFRMLVTSKSPSRRSNTAADPAAMWASESLRKRAATSFSSRTVEGESLSKRIAGTSAGTGTPAIRDASLSAGR